MQYSWACFVAVWGVQSAAQQALQQLHPEMFFCMNVMRVCAMALADVARAKERARSDCAGTAQAMEDAKWLPNEAVDSLRAATADLDRMEAYVRNTSEGTALLRGQMAAVVELAKGVLAAQQGSVAEADKVLPAEVVASGGAKKGRDELDMGKDNGSTSDSDSTSSSDSDSGSDSDSESDSDKDTKT